LYAGLENYVLLTTHLSAQELRMNTKIFKGIGGIHLTMGTSSLALLGSGACLLISALTPIYHPWKMTWLMESFALICIGGGIPALYAGWRKKTSMAAKVILSVNTVVQGVLATFIDIIIVRERAPFPLFLIISLSMMAVFCVASFAIVLRTHSSNENEGI
jgi:hypothetical protein